MSGLRKLELGPDALASFPTVFQHGMPARARVLGDQNADHPDKWLWGNGAKTADAVIVLYETDADALRKEIERQMDKLRPHGCVYTLQFKEMTEKGVEPREAFGFIDGTSQPIVRGTRKWEQQRNAIHMIEPGEMILGYKDNLKFVSPTPHWRGFDLGRNGSYLVVRQMEQDPDAFKRFLEEAAKTYFGDARVPGDRSPEELEEWIAAKMVGRWRDDGTSLVRYPDQSAKKAKTPAPPDNDFLFGTEDPSGVRCPFGAHVRRANPRDSFKPNSLEQIAITNRHRIFRVGRSYEPQGELKKPGLFFMCVNADIEGQFEFLHQTWVLGPTFHGLGDEIDPVVGYRERAEQGDVMTIPTEKGPICLKGMRDFVTVRGGGYFFMPSREALARLAA